ncbi:MAG: phage terminase large subunit [Leptolyngbya sp. UWPOB_LEPTO1]|uniref:phage terminase large subunit n=1 Tax=Leptolyngbya sp. UWPOB_LEPTO1 TaxID=2815653 RepID=UPI001AD5FAA6|nr:phage terminase large subunit [Leptolyngbya sp. UWPOB_LEPTO1]MBN8564897.1 phage terminase large subunit [Leptolyngbya sp. UWPOB_LEPTO1]
MSQTVDQGFVLNFLRDNLAAYSAAMFPEFKPGRHHKLIAEKLESVNRGEIKRLCVTMAPRHGKSKLASELFPSFYLGHHPTHRILSLSYGQDLADVFGRSVRNYIKSPTFGALFPDCKLSPDSSSIKRFNVSPGGGYAAIGVGGATTGRGANLLILDDLVKDRQQADSPAYRETLIDWYKSVARTRLQPDGAIVLVQTRWGTTDFVQWLLDETEHEGWETISLPAIALENDPLGRKPGEPLWTEAYNLDALSEIRATLGSRDWWALYQQQPISDADVIFESRYLQFYRELPKHLEIYQSWDLTFGGMGEGSSWVVGQVWGISGKDKYLVAMDREQRGFSSTLAAIESMRDRYPATRKIYIENKAMGSAVIETLQKKHHSKVVPVTPTTSKEQRAYEVLPNFERGEVYLPDPTLYPWVKPLLNEIELFPKGATDDCIDSMTQFLSQKLKRASPAIAVGKLQTLQGF